MKEIFNAQILFFGFIFTAFKKKMNPNKALKCLFKLSLRFLYRIGSSSSFCKFICKTPEFSLEFPLLWILLTSLGLQYHRLLWPLISCQQHMALIWGKVWTVEIMLFPRGGTCPPYCDSGVHSGAETPVPQIWGLWKGQYFNFIIFSTYKASKTFPLPSFGNPEV